MPASFNAFEYVHYVRSRWRFPAIAVAVALVLSLGVSLLLPKRYTAIASIVIDPPAGEDARMAVAVSTMYLESLKTFEAFASSDSLFTRAIQHFHMGEGVFAEPSESLKRRVLRVTKVRDTRILEIRATLPDAKQAQALAQYVAEETVNLSRANNLASDREVSDQAQKQFEAAKAKFDQVQAEWARYMAGESAEALEKEVESVAGLQGTIREQLMSANADVAEYESREKAMAAGGTEDSRKELAFVRQGLGGTRARAAMLAKQNEELRSEAAAKRHLLEQRKSERDVLIAKFKTAQSNFDEASSRLRGSLSLTGLHGERLHVVDPGIVPQRPSAPNVVLNVLAALLIALVVSLVYLTISFNYQVRRSAEYEPVFGVSSRAHD